MTQTNIVEHEIKIKPTPSTQVKLLASLQTQQIDEFASTLKGMFGLGEYSVDHENTKNVTDDYYDTPNFVLLKNNAVLRVRREGAQPKIVAKSMISKSDGEFKRKEYEQPTTERELQSHILSNFSKIAPIAFPSQSSPIFKKKLRVTNERRNYLVSRTNEEYRLSLDTYFYTNPANGLTSNQFFEIEIEALTNEASNMLPKLKSNLSQAIKSPYSYESKYEAGVKKLRIDRPKIRQWIFEKGNGEVLNWTNFLIGLASLLIGVAATWFVTK